MVRQGTRQRAGGRAPIGVHLVDWHKLRMGLSLVSFALMLLALNQLAPSSLALENGLARTPPMGWLAWERFTCQVDCQRYPKNCINNHLFEEMAVRLFEDKWLEIGYDHVNIDDCWSERERDNLTNRLVPDHERFKEGIASVAAKVHSYPNLKLGIYGDCGTRTCAGYPAQLKSNHTQEDDDYKTATYFQLDADTLAEWQVDSLKFDGCFVDPLKAERICPNMAKALAETGRPIMLVCEWPFYMMYAHAEPDFEVAAKSCNVWRYYDDIEDSWLSILNTIDYTVRHQSTMLKYHGPGHWFDPDQLVIGNFGLSVGQARAQMAIWCVWAAPLYMSNDLREMRPEMAEILANRKLIAVNQDELGVLGQMVAQSEDKLAQAFVKPVLPVKNKCPSFAVVFLYRATLGNRRKVSFKLADLLLAAPIRQAAVNQVRVEAYKRQQQRESHDELLLAALNGAQPSGDEPQSAAPGETIDTVECLERLEASLNNESQQEQPGDDAVRYQMFDLFDQSGAPQRELSLRDSLELLVDMSSVRAVKLVEK